MKNVLATIITATLLSAVAPSVLAQEGKAEDGHKKAAMCIGCHGIPGYQASFPEVYKVPMIGGQNAKYISAALTAYKKGDRRHPTMRAIAESLSDQDMADLGAYYASQAGELKAPAAVAEPSGPVAELFKKGACATCHGANLSTPIDPSYPKLAGQHPDYLYVALKSYSSTGNALFGRSHAIMGAQVKPFSHVELKAMSAYLAGLPGEVKTVSQSRFR